MCARRRISWDIEPRQILLLYSCYLKEETVKTASTHVGRSVSTALNLNENWHPALKELRFLKLREVGVPLRAGTAPNERLPTVLLHVLVYCEGDLKITDPVPKLCNIATASVRRGLRRSSVTLVVSEPRDDPFNDWPENLVDGLDQLRHCGASTDDVFKALVYAARVVDQEVKDLSLIHI